ncbi:MAG TPA: carboxypeptidase-like regulatory domain-containing protein [Luteitalea sp.]|nr:carboxypeptidase-like regulatory domain-containing protein [Luteitalea sp.]
MRLTSTLLTGAVLALLGYTTLGGQAAQGPAAGIAKDADDIVGVVTGPKGPEGGVWVIAETTDLPTKFVRIVVTDDQGRYLVPDLPKASYQVWVRGYGLVDSPKTAATPGQTVALKAVPAPDAKAAAHYYPSGYWLSLLEVPAASEFPGNPTSGIQPAIATQQHYLRIVKNGGCTACHGLGTIGTRTILPALGTFNNSTDAWMRRLASGQAGADMVRTMNAVGPRMIQEFAKWTDRIKAGEVPQAPPRPQGLERNVVITQWDWADPKHYLHDEVSTDRRTPTINANGPLYGALELSADYVPVLDPKTHTASRIPLTVRDPATPATSQEMAAPSPYWGSEPLWNSKNNVHNPMLDHQGRLWLTSAMRPFDNPAFCKEGSTHPSAKLTPIGRSSRHLQMYDPKTKKLTHISTCFGTHHLAFAEDANNTLWTSGGGQVVGWLNTKLFEQTGDEEKSQGWTALIMDTNGNGTRDAAVEPNQPVDPTKDKRYNGAFYSVQPAPDGSIWGSVLGFPGAAVRLVPGNNPPETTLVEVYEPPFDHADPQKRGFSPRGMDVDRNGVVWAAMASGHMASFDRRKCKGPLNGPKATGNHCPEGWTLYAEPLPQLKGVTDGGSAEGSYYTWVDWFDTLGIGSTNTPINTGNESEGLLVLKDGKWVVLRVPYPLGYYTKWMDGRIDDPKGGWKGRGLYSTISTRAPFHMEGGKGTSSKIVRFQMRPDPLAK